MKISTERDRGNGPVFTAICRLSSVLLFAFGNWFCWYSLMIHDEHASRNWVAGNYLYFLLPSLVGAVAGVFLAGGIFVVPSVVTRPTQSGKRVMVLLGLLFSFAVTFYLGQSEAFVGFGIAKRYGFRLHRLLDGLGLLVLAAANGYAMYRVLRIKK